MFRRFLSLLAAALLTSTLIGQNAEAKKTPPKAAHAKTIQKSQTTSAAYDGGAETGLDLTLRSNAAAMTVKTADGSALETAASHMVLMDYNTGDVLAEKALNEKMYPSSMTKMMTMYIIFERLKQGTLSLDAQFTISEKAWRMQGSKMFVPIGAQVRLEDLIRGISIQSGNDACVAVAEGIAGSEESFAKIMNDTAQKLGMKHTNFTDSSGWPNPNNTTTPHDLAILGAALVRDFPQYYHYFSEREYTFHNIRQFNRNLLLNNASLGVDGLKTGHTEAAGYGIALSAKEPATGRRLLLVVNGLNSEAERAQEGERLLKWGFANFENKTLFKANQPIVKTPVWMSQTREMPLTIASNVIVTLPKTGQASPKASVSYKSPLIAPVKKGQEVGSLTITLPNGATRTISLLAAEDAPKLSFFSRITRALGM